MNQYSLIVANGTSYSNDECGKALDYIFTEIKSKGGADSGLNFILYIHGRGKEPQKSIAKVIPQIESEYGAKVLMFHWPSWAGPLGHPIDEAEGGASHLGKVLTAIKTFKLNNQTFFPKVRCILIAHSMGNIVFSTLIKSLAANSHGNPLFETVILNAADVEADDHASWVEKIDFSNNIYITVNEHDGILKLSAKRRHGKRLGQALESFFGHDFKLASNATYVDFSETGVNHRYFIKNGQNDNPYIEEFYSHILNGLPINLDSADFSGIKEKKSGNNNVVYVFKGE